MHNALSYKTKQFFFVLIKLSIVAGAFYFIYIKLTNNPELDFNDFVQFLIKNDAFSLKTVLLLLFLSSFNWFFEILKWKYLVSHIKTITFKNALEQSLGGLTASLFTPNRLGEYAAKAVYFPSGYRKRIVLLNLLGNMMQMGVTFLLGLIGFIVFVKLFPIQISYPKLARLIIIALLILSFVGLSIKKSSITIKGVSIEKILIFIKGLPLRLHINTFLLSLIRYLIFSFQFYYLLHIFGVNLSYFNAMTIITTMYLFASIIPSIFIFDVVIKGSVAVYLFSLAGINEFMTLSIIMIMWLLNFVFPSLFGSYYVLNFDLPKSDDSI